ncbi:MAG: endo-1,3-alpha-glucanase family glycosylhydrolase [Puniceicoccales bacterium]
MAGAQIAMGMHSMISTSLLVSWPVALCLSGCDEQSTQSANDSGQARDDSVPASVSAPVWEPGAESPLIAMHYMPWFNNPHTSTRGKKEWAHWAWSDDQVSHNPETVLKSGQRDVAALNYPLIGAYSSDNEAVVRYHFQLAKAVGIDAVFIIWYGPGSDTDELVPMLLDEAQAAGLKLAICYEEKLNWPPYRNPKNRAEIVETATDDLNYILEEYAGHPAYLYRGDQPFIYQFNFWGEGALGKQNILPDEWSQIFAALHQPVAYARQNLNPEYHPEIGGAYVWWTADDSYLQDFSEFSRDMVDAGKMDFFMTMAAPGFDDSGVNGWGHGPRVTPRNGIDIWEDTFSQAFDGNPEVIQLVTWNDFNEGTAIEPTMEEGYLYLDSLETWIGERTGRAVDLGDNHQPLEQYRKGANTMQLNELPDEIM